MEFITKTVTRELLRSKYVKLPEVVLEEQHMSKGTNVVVYYGSNYSCCVILPVDSKLGKIQRERLSKLINEKLEQEN